MKNQALKACFLHSPRLGENVVRPYNEVNVCTIYILLKPHKTIALAASFYYNVNIFGT